VVPEARPHPSEYGLVPTGEDGWYVLNGRDVRWRRCEGMGKWPSFEGATVVFRQLGVSLRLLEPGETMAMYHWEADQEDFLVVSGEALLIVEGEERPLRAWDFFHCPAGAKHVIVGAGDGLCLVLAVGSRANQMAVQADGTLDATPDWGGYPVDEAAIRHGAGVEEETTDASVAYARFPDPESIRYEEGLLPW
jgi:quercetin dioxygenase-like cupin family protein